MKFSVPIAAVAIILVVGALAWRLKRAPVAAPAVAPATTSQTPIVAPSYSPADLLPKLRTFAIAIPQSLMAARREANPSAAQQKWKVDVVRVDIENSPSALHPLEGVIGVREILDDPRIFYSDNLVLRLSFDGSKWNLDQATSDESSGLVGREPGPRHTADVTDWPPLARAIQGANGQ